MGYVMMNDQCEVDISCHHSQAEYMNECYDCNFGCAKCTKDEYDLKCDACEPEFIFNQYGKCEFDITCDKYETEFMNKCYDCAVGCKECSTVDGVEIECQTCADNYVMIDEECEVDL